MGKGFGIAARCIEFLKALLCSCEVDLLRERWSQGDPHSNQNSSQPAPKAKPHHQPEQDRRKPAAHGNLPFDLGHMSGVAMSGDGASNEVARPPICNKQLTRAEWKNVTNGRVNCLRAPTD